MLAGDLALSWQLCYHWSNPCLARKLAIRLVHAGQNESDMGMAGKDAGQNESDMGTAGKDAGQK